MALESDYKEIESTSRHKEINDSRAGTPNDEVTHEFDAVTFCFFLRLCHQLRKFAINCLFLAAGLWGKDVLLDIDHVNFGLMDLGKSQCVGQSLGRCFGAIVGDKDFLVHGRANHKSPS